MAKGAKGDSGGLFSRQLDLRIAAVAIVVTIAICTGLYITFTKEPPPIITPPSPEEATEKVLFGTMERVVLAFQNGSKAPKTLAELPLHSNPQNNITADGWGNPVGMKVTGGGNRYIVEVRSYGPDAIAATNDDIVVNGHVDKDPSGLYFLGSAEKKAN